jgi:pilus assembly protein CpaC
LGRATVVIWSNNRQRKAYDVTVEPNLDPLRRLLRDTFPDENISLEAGRESLVLVGSVSSQAIADRALALVNSAGKPAVSNLKVAPAGPEKQVLLRVRFAELDRNTAAQFGVNLLSTGALNTVGGITSGQFPSGTLSQVGPGSGTSAFSLSDMLNIFAFRPDLDLGVLIRDLVTSNGKEASFLAGGEIPVPVVQAGASAGAITVQYREYGIRLSFTPWITAHRTVRMHIKPEVSSLDTADGVTVSGFNIPALTTRRMETDIELEEGQSFAIAGLLDQRVTENLSQIPGLAHIPVLGSLFKSRSESRQKTELIVVVTPAVVSPGSNQDSMPKWLKPFLDGGSSSPAKP